MSFDVFGLILQAGLIVKLVLLILFAFSLISWAIILSKWKELRGASEDSEAFLEIYHDRPFDAAYDAARELLRSPAAAVFVSSCGGAAALAAGLLPALSPGRRVAALALPRRERGQDRAHAHAVGARAHHARGLVDDAGLARVAASAVRDFAGMGWRDSARGSAEKATGAARALAVDVTAANSVLPPDLRLVPPGDDGWATVLAESTHNDDDC